MSLKEELTRQIIEQGAKRKLQRSLRFTDVDEDGDEKGYRIRFLHQHDTDKYIKDPENYKYGVVRAITHCYIEEWKNKDWRLHTWGQARCSLDDRYLKETGRRISLERAVKGQSRDFRGRAWSTYLERAE